MTEPDDVTPSEGSEASVAPVPELQSDALQATATTAPPAQADQPIRIGCTADWEIGGIEFWWRAGEDRLVIRYEGETYLLLKIALGPLTLTPTANVLFDRAVSFWTSFRKATQFHLGGYFFTKLDKVSYDNFE